MCIICGNKLKGLPLSLDIKKCSVNSAIYKFSSAKQTTGTYSEYKNNKNKNKNEIRKYVFDSIL